MSKTVTPSIAGLVEIEVTYVPSNKVEVLTTIYNGSEKLHSTPYDLEHWRGPSRDCYRAIKAKVYAQLEALEESLVVVGVHDVSREARTMISLALAEAWWALSQGGLKPSRVTVTLDSSSLVS